MAIDGLEDVRRALLNEARKITEVRARKTVTEVLIQAAGYAATMTPIDTSNLINSQYRVVKISEDSVSGMLGYTAAYAAAVHDAAGTYKGRNIMRDKKDPGRGVFWAPDGEPQFLRKAFEQADSIRDIEAIVKRNMQI